MLFIFYGPKMTQLFSKVTLLVHIRGSIGTHFCPTPILALLTTEGPQITSLHSISFCYNVSEKKKLILGWDIGVCEFCTFSPCLHRFSPGSPVSFHIPKMCTWDELMCLHWLSLRKCVCVAGGGRALQWNCVLSSVGPALYPEWPG